MKIKNFLTIVLIAVLPLIGEARSIQVTQITGGNESFKADVIQEDGANKLLVKSTQIPEALGNLFFLHAENGGSSDLTVNGSGTAVEFFINSEAQDMIVKGLAFESFSSGIKLDKFLSLNSALTNGVIVEVKSEDQVFQFLAIKSTIEFDSHFAWGEGRSYELNFASGNDSMVARFELSSPFILKKTGTYINPDYIKVIIRDNLSSVNNLQFIAFGNRDM